MSVITVCLSRYLALNTLHWLADTIHRLAYYRHSQMYRFIKTASNSIFRSVIANDQSYFLNIYHTWVSSTFLYLLFIIIYFHYFCNLLS
jgi:hypothetical protein